MPDLGDRLGRATVAAMGVADVGFLAYWLVVATGVLPADAMFAEYADPQVAAWNWSFLPLDVVASLTGLVAIRAARRGAPDAPVRIAVSLALTATAGGMAIAYWSLRGQLDAWWWAPNLALLVFPLPLLIRLAGPRGCVSTPHRNREPSVDGRQVDIL